MRTLNEHSFPEYWLHGTLNRLTMSEFALQLYREMPNTAKNSVMVDSSCSPLLDQWYSDFTSDHTIAVAFVDPYHDYAESLSQYFPKHNLVSMDVYKDFSFFGRFCYNIFRDRYIHATFPMTIDNLFLFYNRKPRPFRTSLVNKMREANLQDHGIITLGVFKDDRSKTHNNELLTIPENDRIACGNTLLDESKTNGIPNDITTFGDMDIWSSSFINVVSETTRYELFVTEKIFKPIMGMRPFILNAAPKTLKLLRWWGFKTFSDFWDESYDEMGDDDAHNHIVEIFVELSKKSKSELYDMANRMRPILEYNHHHFFNAYSTYNRSGFLYMAKWYVNNYGCPN